MNELSFKFLIDKYLENIQMSLSAYTFHFSFFLEDAWRSLVKELQNHVTFLGPTDLFFFIHKDLSKEYRKYYSLERLKPMYSVYRF
jgi:hypothetical protein